MSGGKIIAHIFAGIVILFGFLFLLGAFSPEGSTGWIITGSILIGVGFIIIWLTSKTKTRQDTSQGSTTLNIDLPGDVNLKRFDCQNCGSPLSMDNVKMVAGAPMVDCPYCDAAYQLIEEPKW